MSTPSMPLPQAAAASAQEGAASPPGKMEFDPRIQLGRSGLKQYGGFLFEEFLHTLRGREGAKAYREVLDNSPLVGGIDRLLKLTMRQVNKYTTPFSDDPEDVERAHRIDQALDDMSVSWPDLMAEITTMLGYGYAPMEVVWKTCRGWSEDGSTRSRFNDGLIMPRKIYLMAQDSLFRWDFDQDGGVRAFIQLPPPDYVMRTVPIEKMLLFRPHIEKGNPEGQSLLRSGYFSWIMVKRLVEFEAITGERDATGVPVARIPAINMQAGATPAQVNTFNAFKKVVQNLKIDDQMGIVIPSDVWPDGKTPMFDVSLLGVSGRTQHFDFGTAITRHEVRLAISMLADIMLLGHDKVGSFSLSRDKRSMLADALGAWLDAIMGVLNRHLLPRIYAYNGWPMDRMCTLGHGGVEVADIEALANAALKLSQAGMPLFPDPELENHVRAEAGWPEKKDADEEDYLQVAPEDSPDDPGGPAGDTVPVETRPSTARPTPQPVLQKFRHQPRSRRGAYSPRSGDVFSALQLLRDRARVGYHGDEVNHGFHVEDPPAYDRRMVSAADVDEANVERVPLKGLTATQPTVRRDAVQRFLENPGIVVPGQRSLSGHLEDRPVIVRAGGKQYIHDGHSRLSAHALLGTPDALARVVELEPHVTAPSEPSTTTGLPANQGTPRNAGRTTQDLSPQQVYDPNTELTKGEGATWE